MKKVLLSLFLFLSLTLTGFSNEIDKLIKQNGFDLKSIVAIYVENQKDRNVVYKKNSKKLLNPASTLKTLTFGASYIVLGDDYDFETVLYKDKQNNIYLKLSGDTLLTSSDLKELFSKLKKKVNVEKIQNIYIDDSIFDNDPYPNGWMKDDMWPNQKPITAYIVDNNTVKLNIRRSSLATKVDIIQSDDYKFPIVNELKPGEVHDYDILRKYGEKSPIISFAGSINKDETLVLPVLFPQLNFNIKLKNAIVKNDIPYFKKIEVKKIPNDVSKIASVKHSIEDVSKSILFDSDNFASEVVFRVAAAKYINYKRSATLKDSINMFYDIYKDEITEGIKVVDASGVSHYDLVSAEFLTNCLVMLFEKTNIEKLLPTANQGTLKDRLGFLEGNIKAKTGTHSQLSALLGGFKTRKGKNIVFAIIIQNSPKRKAILKNFENTLVGTIYKNY